MRILTIGNMYPPHHLGGYELTWRSAVDHLRGDGHAVRVLTTDFRRSAPDPDIPEDPEAYRELRWYWRDHRWPRLSLRERIELERTNGETLERHLEEHSPDVVNWWAMGGMSLSLIERVRLAGLPSVGVVGDDWMVYAPKVDSWMRLTRRLGPFGGLLSRLVALPARFDLSGPTWLFNSVRTRERALGEGRPLPHAEIAHPGVDESLFRPAPARAWRWSLLYVGRIDERKGIDSAVEALASLPGEARLAVLGSGDDDFLAELHERCSSLGLNGRVDFGVRPRAELAEAYADADVLLFPVRWEEPWGLVPLEAMAVGTPVVATGTGGSGEYLRDGQNALVVGGEAGPDELAAAVERLVADEALREHLRQGGLETASRYTERAYNEAIAAALERVVAEAG
ncbi:MAG TPA: glycosyltransferase family 4 protein [Thermoleophilaceae bacterium]